MHDKELRLALICYGGISLAVYMHGITKEIWHLIRASQRYNRRTDGVADSPPGPYDELFAHVAERGDIRLRVLVDIVAGASAGGINGIFLGQAITSGQSLDPLTDLWLDKADVEKLLDPDARPWSRFSKFWAVPFAWLMLKKPGGTIDISVEKASRAEVRRKLSNFVRARWFAPPFGGALFTRLLLDAFDAMAQQQVECRLLPDDHPLDLFVTVTDFRGHAERLKLNSPPQVDEHEHRMILSFSDHGVRDKSTSGSGPGSGWSDTASLAFAARATASFPGAFPPFNLAEIDGVLQEDGRDWPDRAAFLARNLPPREGRPDAAEIVLIDGSVLANAPFKPAIQALRNRPARREIDRRFVYIDPKPGIKSIGGKPNDRKGLPGFFGTIFGALSDIPREQPIRDNLEAIEGRSARIRRMQRILDAIQPEVESVIAATFGRTLFLDRPTPARLNGWRKKAQAESARRAGYFYPSYGHLKLSQVTESISLMINDMAEVTDPAIREANRQAVWSAVRRRGIDAPTAMSSDGASDVAIAYFRDHDLSFRIRRLRMLNRKGAAIYAATPPGPDRDAVQTMRDSVFRALADYLDLERVSYFPDAIKAGMVGVRDDPEHALELLAKARDLKRLDAAAEQLLADGLAQLPRLIRRDMLLTYLGFPFYDIATLPLLQESDFDEFDPIKVDRISPRDAQSLRQGGPEVTLKGIQFNSFGAFFSRSYRENDYLWGRLHGADRLIDIVLSTVDEPAAHDERAIRRLKKHLFQRILSEERPRLTSIVPLLDQLETQIAGWE